MTLSRTLIYTSAAIAVAVIAVLYFMFDPAASSMAPKCMFRTFTGLECPGCGSQRMLHALLHGDIRAAWGYNPFLMCMFPLLGAMLFSAGARLRFPRLYAALNSMPVIICICVSILAWTIWRNL